MIFNLILGLVFLLLGLISLVSVACGHPGPDGRSAGMGGIGVCLQDFWSLQNNQAGITKIANIQVGCAYENRFLLSETGKTTIGILYPINNNVVGLVFNQFGDSRYKKMMAGLAYARSFSDKFSMGIQLDYVGVSLGEGYGRRGSITFETGIQVLLTDNLLFGVHVLNPLGLGNTENLGEKVISLIKFGLQYNFTEFLLVGIEIEKDLYFNPAIKAGLEYEFSSHFLFRLGYTSLPSIVQASRLSMSSEYSFGIGMAIRGLKIDLAASINTFLGWSPVVSVIYNIRKNEVGFNSDKMP